jgi:hypothetical protein
MVDDREYIDHPGHGQLVARRAPRVFPSFRRRREGVVDVVFWKLALPYQIVALRRPLLAPPGFEDKTTLRTTPRG